MVKCENMHRIINESQLQLSSLASYLVRSAHIANWCRLNIYFGLLFWPFLYSIVPTLAERWLSINRGALFFTTMSSIGKVNLRMAENLSVLVTQDWPSGQNDVGPTSGTQCCPTVSHFFINLSAETTLDQISHQIFDRRSVCYLG